MRHRGNKDLFIMKSLEPLARKLLAETLFTMRALSAGTSHSLGLAHQDREPISATRPSRTPKVLAHIAPKEPPSCRPSMAIPALPHRPRAAGPLAVRRARAQAPSRDDGRTASKLVPWRGLRLAH